MIGLQSAIRTVALRRSLMQSRSVTSGPPQVRISFPEKAAHGIFIAVALCAYPAWVLGHIKDYRGPPESTD